MQTHRQVRTHTIGNTDTVTRLHGIPQADHTDTHMATQIRTRTDREIDVDVRRIPHSDSRANTHAWTHVDTQEHTHDIPF